MNRADTVNIQGHVLESEESLKVLGLSMCTGGALETNARFAAVWGTFSREAAAVDSAALATECPLGPLATFIAPSRQACPVDHGDGHSARISAQSMARYIG